ncbi:MAG: hypothetical protein CL840_07285 [Crocinitomicaceae bacterium]|nr:hypothetical protein [Crocinitomicaceae bacterium]
MKEIKNSYLLVTIVAFFLLWPASNLNWGGNHWVDILQADAKGYYAYLPAVLIYQDLNFGHFDAIEKEKYFDENLFYDYRFYYEGNVVNKYFVGTAILQFPFFLMAHAYASISDDWDADGFSKPYLVAINMGAIVYLILGLMFLLKALEPLYGSMALVSTVFVLFATNLFYYVVVEPGMSHVYNFFLVSALVFFLFKNAHANRFQYLLLAGLCYGLIILVRPVNALILLAIPFLLGGDKFSHLMSNARAFNRLIPLVLLVVGVVSIQALIYYLQTGYLWVYSYGNEGFNWSKPQIFNALFSFKKGAFIYTPILLLGFPALLHYWKKDRFRFWGFIFFIVPTLYVLYSWWNWWYGGSFSQRVLIEYYPVILALIVPWLHQLDNKAIKKLVLTYSVICLIWCQFQTYQYRYYIIHWEDMTAQTYFDNLFVLPGN